MARPKGGYPLHDGTKGPGVTTVLSRFKECGGLVHWSWKLGMEGKNYRDVRDKAADAGTLAHAMVEQWIRKAGVSIPPGTPPEINRKASTSFQAFLEWAEQSKLQVTHTEVSLVSEQYGFGGTLDAILVNGRRAMGDWKTANATYPENLIQLAAYGKLWEENRPQEPVAGGFHLLRFDREYGDFHHHFWAELDSAWLAFTHLLALYRIDKELKQRVK